MVGPVQKLIPICPRKESVVPLRQSWVFEKIELGHHGIGDFDLSGIMTDGHPQLVRINQFFLEGEFPEPSARAVAAAAIGACR